MLLFLLAGWSFEVGNRFCHRVPEFEQDKVLANLVGLLISQNLRLKSCAGFPVNHKSGVISLLKLQMGSVQDKSPVNDFFYL